MIKQLCSIFIVCYWQVERYYRAENKLRFIGNGINGLLDGIAVTDPGNNIKASFTIWSVYDWIAPLALWSCTLQLAFVRSRVLNTRLTG